MCTFCLNAVKWTCFLIVRGCTIRGHVHLAVVGKEVWKMGLGFRGAERERSERDAGDRLVYEANAKLVESFDPHQAFVDVDSSAHSCLVLYHCTSAPVTETESHSAARPWAARA